MTKYSLIEEYKDTTEACMNGFYRNNEDDTVILQPVKFDDIVLYDQRFLHDEDDTDNDRPFPTIEVVDNDTLSDARELVEQGYNVTILNMASSFLPGGGVMKGSKAQEEDLFRRTNLMTGLYLLHPIGSHFGITVTKNHIFYPIDGKYDVIWTPRVQVFKDSMQNNFSLLDKPFPVNVITCAAVRKPTLVDGKLNSNDKNVMECKIRSILDCAAIAAPHTKNALVLGAFGCGAYGNPPEQIARMFNEQIAKCKAIKNIDLIHFAIIDSNCVGKKHNPNGNFKPFYNEFIDILPHT